MARIRVTSNGPANLGAAGIPLPVKDARSYQARGVIEGSPGVIPVAAPRPDGVPQGWPRRLHGSMDAPAYWRPSVYYLADRPTVPVSVYSDNQMPMPALGPDGKPAIAFVRPVFLNQTQIGNAKRITKYPNRNGS